MLPPLQMPPSSRRFQGQNLLQISMPMGGIGAGCICLSGYGALQDFSIRNRPSITALPDDISNWNDGGFAIVHIRGERPVTRLLEGPLPPGKVYDQGLQASGYRKVGYEGLPRLQNCQFLAAYPFGQVQLADEQIPLRVNLTGWSPFIPLDDRTSSMPCAILEYQLKNGSTEAVDFDFSYHLSHLPRGAGGWRVTRSRAIEGGILFHNEVPPNDETFGTATLTVLGHDPLIKAMWPRGNWFDWIAALWAELGRGEFLTNNGNADRPLDGRNGGSLLVRAQLQPGQSITFPILITWHIPNVYLKQLQPHSPPWWLTAPPTSNVPADQGPAWRPYYAGQWQDAQAVARELRRDFESIRSRTLAFRDGLFDSTFPPEALDAIASNLAILKSPTVLREENGHLWAWEGCFPTGGCCPGSCTHVWNYAQSLPQLFPSLERTLREQEYQRSMDPTGHVNFRAALPDGPPEKTGAAADGQLGGLAKLYRDWHISGDTAWLATLYPLAKRSLQYCIAAWDPDQQGALFEPHHNTYDIEFWGPDGMCTGVYVAALCAAAEMGRALDDPAAPHFADLAARAAAYCDQQLYNGQYYHQNVLWHQLKDDSFTRRLQQAGEQGSEIDPAVLAVLQAEGPPYQYGSGCLSDGVIGHWMATLYGIDTPLDAAHVRSTLAAIFKHNFRADLWGHACTQRPGYAIGHEPGLILCTWPNGNRPTLPFVYSDEVWTGVEYQVASHLVALGMIQEGMTLVRAVRSRYAGDVRNPFNEYECGSYYARAMASFALLATLSGFRYSQVTRTLWFDPRLPTRPWRSFLCAASGWGMIHLDAATLTVEMTTGTLAVEQLIFGHGPQQRAVHVAATATAQRPVRIPLDR